MSGIRVTVNPATGAPLIVPKSNINVYKQGGGGAASTTAGNFLQIANNLSDLQSIPASRTNLGVYSTTETDNAIALRSISTKTANYTLVSTDYTILGDATVGAITLTLPAAASHTGRTYNIKRISAGAFTVTVSSTDLIDGGATAVLNSQYESITVQSNGSTWFIL